MTVAGCKQLDWNAERRLIDVGLSTSRWAERLTLIDADELDQGQYDGRSDTFAVNSAGMLVRRDVWEQLGGFDPALPGTGDDVDFCWRNRLAGHRVVVVPTARMFHVAHRPHGLGDRRGRPEGRRSTCASSTPRWWKVPLHARGALLGSLFKLVAEHRRQGSRARILPAWLATFAALGRPGAVAPRTPRGGPDAEDPALGDQRPADSAPRGVVAPAFPHRGARRRRRCRRPSSAGSAGRTAQRGLHRRLRRTDHV